MIDGGCQNCCQLAMYIYQHLLVAHTISRLVLGAIIIASAFVSEDTY